MISTLPFPKFICRGLLITFNHIPLFLITVALIIRLNVYHKSPAVEQLIFGMSKLMSES